MVLTSIINSAAGIAYRVDRSLGIDYQNSIFPTRAGLQNIANSSYQHTATVLQREMFNKTAFERGAKIVGLTAVVYAALC